MTRLMQITMILGVCGAMLLGGCSGAGISSAGVRQEGLQTFAADQLATLVLVKGWLAALRSNPVVGGDCIPELDSEITPDGFFHVWGTNSDCSTYDFIDRGGLGEGTWAVSYTHLTLPTN